MCSAERSGGGLRAAQGLAAIAERLGDMDAGDAHLAIEVSKSPSDTKSCRSPFSLNWVIRRSSP